MILSLSVFMIVISVILFSIAVLTTWWMMHAWRTPETLAATRFPDHEGEPELSFSLLVPARHEEQVLEHTVRGLLKSSYSDYEILVIVGHDDPDTARVAMRLASQAPERVRVVTDTHEVKNKPKALNTALPLCKGDVVGVFDAEDQVHPDLLTHVDRAFVTTNADVVQGGVQLINVHSSWYALRNCLEYFFWFRSRLHLHAQKGFIPLGGNTVFVRTQVLRDADGWDQTNLTEDCDLGVRLSGKGAKFVVAYDAAMVTREETPDSLYGLMKQRTRWNQGFLQVFRKKDWKRLPTLRQRMLARYTLTMPFLQAFSGLIIPLGIAVGIVARLPIAVALVTFLPIVPMIVTLGFEAVGLHDFGELYGVRIGFGQYVKLVVGLPFYMLILAWAALRAVWRELRGHNNWELTRHVGAHLGDEAEAQSSPDDEDTLITEVVA